MIKEIFKNWAKMLSDMVSSVPEDDNGAVTPPLAVPCYYRLQVFLVYADGKHYRRPPWRTIDILSSQTLATLSDAIFQVFEREERHHWSFVFDSDNPYSPRKGRHYLDEYGLRQQHIPRPRTYNGTTVRLDTLGLQQDMEFLYWFDFRNDYIHSIQVLDIRDVQPADGEEPWILVESKYKVPRQKTWLF